MRKLLRKSIHFKPKGSILNLFGISWGAWVCFCRILCSQCTVEEILGLCFNFKHSFPDAARCSPVTFDLFIGFSRSNHCYLPCYFSVSRKPYVQLFCHWQNRSWGCVVNTSSEWRVIWTFVSPNVVAAVYNGISLHRDLFVFNISCVRLWWILANREMSPIFDVGNMIP